MGRVVCGASCYGASCPWGELSMGRVLHGVSCLWDELSMGRDVVGRVVMGRVVRGASCLGASGPGTHDFTIDIFCKRQRGMLVPLGNNFGLDRNQCYRSEAKSRSTSEVIF
jgi:hypothetical protein